MLPSITRTAWLATREDEDAAAARRCRAPRRPYATSMLFHRASATGADLEAACRAAAGDVRERLGPGPIDLACVFASPRYGASIDRLPVMLHDMLGARTLVGCSGAAVLDDSRLLAGRHGLAVLAGRLPGTQVDAVALAPADLPSPDAGPAAWRDLLPACDQPRTGMIVLGEPFHGDPRSLLAGLDFGFPGVTKVGGIASGSRHPEGHTLFCGRSTHRSGAVVVAFAGDVELTGVVTPGCRPFGRAGRVTKAQDNRLLAVDHRPAQTFVREQLAALCDEDREVAQASPLLLGLAADPFGESIDDDGEFLVRNILGVDPDGHLVTWEHLPIGRTVRLLMRDAAAGAAALQRRLRSAAAATARGALLFQCLGRESEDHAAFAALAGDVPLVGFHCNGEIGPIGADTHMHAFSSAFAMFRRRSDR